MIIWPVFKIEYPQYSGGVMQDLCAGCPQADENYDPADKDNKIEPFCNNCTRTVSANPTTDAHKFVSLIGFLTAANK